MSERKIVGWGVILICAVCVQGRPVVAAVFPEIEPNSTKQEANPVGPMQPGDAIQGASTGAVVGPANPAPSSADYFQINLAPQPFGIYRYRLVVTTSGPPGHTGTIRGLLQLGGAIQSLTDALIQQSSPTTAPPRYNQWYGFGRPDPIYWRIAGSGATNQPYLATLESQPVGPTVLGAFVPDGNGRISISTVGLSGANSELWVYDAGFNPIPEFGNDDEPAPGTTPQSTLDRCFRCAEPGTYYLALSDSNLAHHLPSPADDRFLDGSVLDLAGAVANSSPATGVSLTFSITDAGGPQMFSGAKVEPFEIIWATFDVVGAPPCDDGNPCTVDTCDSITCQCVNTPIVCDDGDPCTTDSCVGGQCVFQPIVCTDGNPCTSDACVDGTCVYTPIDPAEPPNIPPTACDICPGDVNRDGFVNGADIQGFFDCHPDGIGAGVDCMAADIDGDGDRDTDDIDRFIDILLRSSGRCPSAKSLLEPAPDDPKTPIVGRLESPAARPESMAQVVDVLEDDPEEMPGFNFTNDPPLRPTQKHDGPDTPLKDVHGFSGEFHQEAIDLRIPGRGFPFVWARTYRSRIGRPTEIGNNWDYSYNLRVEPFGRNRVLAAGNGRRDMYCLQPNNTWAHAEYFRVLSRNPDGTYTLMMRTRGRIDFHALDGSAAEGRVSSIVDRNGNAMNFAYDGAGRLTTITDTLGRTIAVAYNGDGRIASVTDFAGRQVVYSYYTDVDAGGSAGDLKSARSPIVVGTPNGNDFPGGKTTTYTYSKGLADERLNHNLLKIVDPKNQAYLANVYAATANPADLAFDHVERQVWGNSGDNVDVTYVALAPTVANEFAIVKAIVNDRVGNVTEYFYNARNRGVIELEYTGRADPDQPTTDSMNRPTAPLRGDDPPFFETKFRWSVSGRCIQVVYPNGNEERFVYDTCNPDPLSRGNLLQYCRLPGTLGGDQAQICESWQYQAVCNFATIHTNGRGFSSGHQYDVGGNRTQSNEPIVSTQRDREFNSFGQLTARTLPENGSGYRRRDEYFYYTAGPQTGYLERIVVDATGLGLTTRLEYDGVGNVVRKIDPRGHDTLLTVNALNQVVREQSREVTTGSGIRYATDSYFDANDNVVRIDVENRDETGTLQSNTHFTTTYEYDTLNRLTRETREESSSHNVVTEYEYDANRNRTLVRLGEAVNGSQPTNTVRTDYDERDLSFRVIRAPGDAAQSTTQFDYDNNRNLKAERRGLEGTPRVLLHSYDGYNRRMSTTDPMGNVTTYSYDPNSNGTQQRTDGELVDVPGGAGNIRLADGLFSYDPNDRDRPVEAAFFDTVTQAPIGDGLSSNDTLYNANGQAIQTFDDNGNSRFFTYDVVNRRLTETDDKGNTVTFAYDGNGNRLQVVELDKSDIGGADETFVTTYEYDGLDRLTRSTGNAGNVWQYQYDSRHNRVRDIDPRGNVMRYEYDGLSRLVRTVRLITDTGDGGGSIIGQVVTQQVHDDTSRLRSRIDDNGNATLYVYDALNRRVAEGSADGTTIEVVTYDIHDNRVLVRDANGSEIGSVFDLNNRCTSRSIVPGPGVSSDTTSESFQYDGLGRVARAEDDDSVITFSYNSLSQITRETIQIAGGPVRASDAVYDGENNLTRLAYPGGRAIARSYDQLDRLATIDDDPPGGGPIATYSYVGSRRIARRDLRNGTRLDFSYDTIRRASATRHYRTSDSSSIDHRTYLWDGANNKTSGMDVLVGGGDARNYNYDSLNRLVRSHHVPLGSPIDYVFDGAGNRASVSGGPEPGSYTRDATTPEPADSQVNQYTTTPFDARLYDQNGNLLRSGFAPRDNAYDYRNRMVRSESVGSGQPTTYRYDCLGRRIEKSVNGAITRFYYHVRQEIEEQDAADSTVATVVWGLGLDEPVQMVRGGATHYFHADDQGNTLRVTDATAAVVEGYDYADYGLPSFFDGSGSSIAASAIGNPHLYNGRRFDEETGFYYYRTRYFDPRSGRFTTRDSIGIWGDPDALGNGYAYVGNNPHSRVDPMGTGFKKALKKLKKSVQKAAKKLQHSVEKRVKEFKASVNDAKQTLKRSLNKLGKVVVRGMIQGAILGAVQGFIAGGFYGALAGAAIGAVEGGIAAASANAVPTLLNESGLVTNQDRARFEGAMTVLGWLGF